MRLSHAAILLVTLGVYEARSQDAALATPQAPVSTVLASPTALSNEQASPDNKKSDSTQTTNSAGSTDHQFVINICRVKSAAKALWAPDVLIDGNKVDSIDNGRLAIYRLNIGQTFKIGTESSFLLSRFKDEYFLKGTAQTSGRAYFVFEGKANFAGALAGSVFGLAGSVTQQYFDAEETPNWRIAAVPPEVYSNFCAKGLSN